MAVLVRAARQSDKTPLMEFISRIWGGHDYVPRVWDEWMRDRGAKMFVVEVRGRPVGMNRVKFLEDGTAWLEGARIHPAFRGRGLASMLGRNSLRLAAAQGVAKVRLVSNSRNWAAHRQIGRMGFKEAARMSAYSPQKSHPFRPRKNVRRAVEDDLPRVTELFQSSKEFKAGGGVYWDGLTAVSLTPDIIRKRIREGVVLVSGDAASVANLGGEGDDVWRQVCFAAGEPVGITSIINHVFGRHERKRTTWRNVYAPQGSPLIATCRAAGLERWSSFILFERKVPKG